VKASRELLEDSLNMETVLPNLLTTALAQEMDRVALLGSGSAPEPRGVANFTGLTSNAFSGGALSSYAPLIQARTALREVDSDVTAYIMTPRDDGTLAGLVDGQSQPLLVPPAIRDIPLLVTSKMPTNLGAASPPSGSQIIAGDWARLLIGIRSEIRVEVLKELFAGNHQFGFVAWMRADVAAEHEAAFTVLDAITP
jgi:HK97 family phage major capsid protein